MFNNKKIIKAYTDMVRIRCFENKIIELYPQKELRTPVHLCLGQEAIAAGVCQFLKKNDYVFTNHRCHGHCIAKGMSFSSIMAELYGKETGCCKGKSGSMHLSDIDFGIPVTSAIVAGAIPIAVGAALSIKLRSHNKVVVVFFGDGAVDEGVFYESLNFAALKKLPVLFVCENNFYATNSHQNQRQPLDNIFKRGEIFGIKGFRCDGNDLYEVMKISEELILKLRVGGGPFLVEFRTFRWQAHVGPESDMSQRCRNKNESDYWLSKCPLANAEKFLLRRNILSKKDIFRIYSKVNQEIDNSVNFAKNSAFPDESDLERGTYY